MKLFSNIRNYVGEDIFKIEICNNKIDIINYKELGEITDNKITVKSDNNIIIFGKNLKVKKLLNDEVLIVGDISKIIFDE